MTARTAAYKVLTNMLCPDQESLSPRVQHAVEVLRFLLFEQKLAHCVLSRLTDSSAFPVGILRYMYEAVRKLIEAGEVPEVGAIMQRVREDGGPSADVIQLHISILDTHEGRPLTEETAIRDVRALLEAYNLERYLDLASLARSWDDALKLADLIHDLDAGGSVIEARTSTEILDSLIAHQRAIDAGESPGGLKSGIGSLDRYLRFSAGLHIVAALAKAFKTHLAISLASNALKAGAHVYFLTAEMNDERLLGRFLGHNLKIDGSKIGTELLPRADFNKILAERETTFEHNPPKIVIDDKTCTAQEGASRVRRYYYREKPAMLEVVIDFLQLLPFDQEARRSKSTDARIIGAAAYTFAKLGKELGIPVILLCQLNRQAEQYEPAPHHISESSGPLQAAESVLLLDPDKMRERREPDTFEPTPGHDPGNGVEGVQLLLAAQRNGRSGLKFPVLCRPSHSEFFELAPEYTQSEFEGVG